MSECPVDSFKDAYPFLRRPFTPAAIKFKVQATWKGGALIVAYIDARLAAGRLNHVIPHKWSTDYGIGPGGLVCRRAGDGITRGGIGSDDVGKGLYSDALKRAAVHFGVAESLYVLPKMTLNEGQLLKGKEFKGKTTYVLTPMGVTHCREVYEHWLESTGKQAFGEPLDHGDVLYEEVEEPVTEPSPMDLFTELARGFEFTDEEKAAIWQYVQVSDENLASATELLEDGNRGALIAGVEFDVKAAA